jgi:regulator of protease activity HflC (stomatin/prohibitin superfamily)
MILKILLVLGILAIGAGTLFKTMIRSIPQDEKAMRTFFGRVILRHGKPIIVGPGHLFTLPWAYSYTTVNVLDHTIRFGQSQIKYSDYVVANFSATATFAVVDIFALRYHVQELEERVSSACVSHLREVLLLLGGYDINKFRLLITAMFAVETAWMKEELGIELKALDITNLEFDSQFAIAGSQAAIAAAIRSLGPDAVRLLGAIDTSPKN